MSEGGWLAGPPRTGFWRRSRYRSPSVISWRHPVALPPDLCMQWSASSNNTHTTMMTSAHSLEASHHTLTQLFERVPRLRTDGPRHLCIIRNDCTGARSSINRALGAAHVPFGAQSRPEMTPCTRCSGRICWRSAEIPAYATNAASSALTPSQGAYPACALLLH